MARSDIANCQYVVDKINQKLGTNYTVAPGTGQRPANKNYLAGWIDKANNGLTNFTSQVAGNATGMRAVNCGTVYDEVQMKVGVTFTIWLHGSSNHGNGVAGSLVLNGVDKTIDYITGQFNATSGPPNITANAPTCIGGYWGFRATNNINDATTVNTINDNLRDFLQKWSWTNLNQNFTYAVEWRGTSSAFGGGGWTMQRFNGNISFTNGIRQVSAPAISNWGAAPTPPPFIVRGIPNAA